MGDTTVSLAKTTRPELANIVLRERLLESMGDTEPVVWVSGPPGSGKTTLVASYLEHRGVSHLWYEIDHADADVATFFLYLGQALAKRAGEAAAQPLPHLSPEYAGNLEVFARRYFRALYSRLERPFAVVFDNYQEVAVPSALHDALRWGLEEVPKGGSVIVTSRADPPPSMARLRANQAMRLIDWEALRLTREELGAMAERRGLSLSEHELEALYYRTEGWAAGAVLMLEHQKTRGELASPPSAAAPQVVFDYLAGEIFDKFEATTQAFLLKAALLPRMSVQMARELSGEERAADLLCNLTRNDYFVTATLSSAGEEYRFHPLLRESLLGRAHEAFSPDVLQRLQREAAHLLREAGQIEAAIELLAESAHWDEVSAIVEEHAATMLGQGRAETLIEWLESVPQRALDAKPWMLYWSGAAHFHVAPREARRFYQGAFERFRAQDPADHKGAILACCGIMDSILYELDDLALLDRWVQTLGELLSTHPEALTRSIEARVTCSMFFSLVLRRPDHPEILAWAERAAALAESSVEPALRMAIEPALALSLMWTGQFAKARAALDRIKRFAEGTELPPAALVTVGVMESMYYMLRGEPDRCLEVAREGLEVCDTHGIWVWGQQLLANAAGALLGAGRIAEAAELLERMEAGSERARRLDRCLLHYLRAWSAMLEGEVLPAFQHQKKALAVATEVGIPFFEVLCRLGLAQVLFACGDERKGRSQLSRVHRMSRDIENHLLEFMTLLVYADIALAHGKRRSGLNSLRYAMALGREYDYRHFLWWQPRMMTELCAVALSESIEEEFVRELIRSRDLYPSKAPLSVPHWPWPFRIHSLGTFRLEVNDKPQSFGAKAPVRPLEMLKILVALGGKDVRAEQLAETMWPHVDGDYAYRSFTTTLHRVRKLLGEDRAVLLQDARVSLNARYVWTDVWALEPVFARIDAVFRGPEQPGAESVAEAAEALLAAYPGAFLSDESERPCYIATREHLRSKFVRYLTKLGRCWEEAGEAETALEYYERGLERDGLAEGFYRQLMLCNQALGRSAEAREVYERCRATLSAALRVAPSPETASIYQRIANGGGAR